MKQAPTLLAFAAILPAQDEVLSLRDVFGLEHVADPQISPSGEHVVYVRKFYDVMTDRAYSNLWIAAVDGDDQRPLTTGHRSPRRSSSFRRSNCARSTRRWYAFQRPPTASPLGLAI